MILSICLTPIMKIIFGEMFDFTHAHVDKPQNHLICYDC